MKKEMQGLSALMMAGTFMLAMGSAGVWANEPGYGHGGGKDGYGGRGHGNLGVVDAVPIPLHGQRYSITVTVPPLAGLFFRNTT